jgi:glycopeptide antibiotics resistance protein
MKKASYLIWAALYAGMIGLSLVPYLLAAPNGSDKFLHVLAYCVLMLPPSILLRTWKARSLVAIGLFATGVADEVLQGVLGGRHSSVEDVVANFCGIVLGLLVGRLLYSGFRAVPNSGPSLGQDRVGERI